MKKVYFVGADVSKEKIDFCFLTSNEDTKPKFVSLPNEINTIKAYFQSFVKDDIYVVFEHTNNYHLPLQSVLSDLEVRYSALSPSKTSYFLKHLTLQKSDITDAYGLALYCRIFKSDLNPSVYNREYSLIKSYNSTILLLSKIQTQLKNFKKSQDFVTDTELSEIIKALNLEEMTAEDIDENDALFGEGLGLDSIDALELIVLMEKKYGIKLANPAEGKRGLTLFLFDYHLRL